METVYPASASALARGRRLRRAAGANRARHRTMPVTFAEIKEVDEETVELEVQPDRTSRGSVERRRPDVLQPDALLGRQFLEFRRRRRTQLREPDELVEASEDKSEEMSGIVLADKRSKETVRSRSIDALTEQYDEVK